ncbi:endolytic transglycosylase MltG [Dactylosporangium sp. NPDC005572]|uniref:endolytic transglycosylase MltG n=1 Tax=Dactylosporangium sp. NPDC005572 TaxID=3156889 RepID=UPI0033BEA2F7
MNELDLAWEEEERPRHRRRASSAPARKKKKGRGGRTFLAFFISLLVIGGLAFGAYAGVDRVKDLFAAPDYNGGGTGEVTVEVKSGQTSLEIAQTLLDAGVIKSTKAFVEAAKKNEERSKKIQPGFYKLRKQMRAADALTTLADPKNKVVDRVTIQEGLTMKATFELLSKETGIKVEEFNAAAKDPIALGVPDFWFNRTDGKPANKTVEGFLFPDTYEFGPGETATTILKKMVAHFLSVVQELDLVNIAQGKELMPFSALINASLVQGEAGTIADMPKVARVIYNRLNKKPPMNLEFDSTTNYWRELQGQPRKHNLTTAELTDPNNPYRTYGQAGLPPGPICSPGKEALNAALNPTPGEKWLYFVLIDKDKNSAFTDDYNQHLRNIETAKKNGAY